MNMIVFIVYKGWHLSKKCVHVLFNLYKNAIINIIIETEQKAKTSRLNESGIRKGQRFTSTTRSSIHFVKDYIKEIGKVEKVDICYGRVEIKGSRGTLIPKGFAVGYR